MYGTILSQSIDQEQSSLIDQGRIGKSVAEAATTTLDGLTPIAYLGNGTETTTATRVADSEAHGADTTFGSTGLEYSSVSSSTAAEISSTGRCGQTLGQQRFEVALGGNRDGSTLEHIKAKVLEGAVVYVDGFIPNAESKVKLAELAVLYPGMRFGVHATSGFFNGMVPESERKVLARLSGGFDIIEQTQELNRLLINSASIALREDNAMTVSPGSQVDSTGSRAANRRNSQPSNGTNGSGNSSKTRKQKRFEKFGAPVVVEEVAKANMENSEFENHPLVLRNDVQQANKDLVYQLKLQSYGRAPSHALQLELSSIARRIMQNKAYNHLSQEDKYNLLADSVTAAMMMDEKQAKLFAMYNGDTYQAWVRLHEEYTATGRVPGFRLPKLNDWFKYIAVFFIDMLIITVFLVFTSRGTKVRNSRTFVQVSLFLLVLMVHVIGMVIHSIYFGRTARLPFR